MRKKSFLGASKLQRENYFEMKTEKVTKDENKQGKTMPKNENRITTGY